MAHYVLCRRADTPSGCEYWTGTVACLPCDQAPGTLAYVGAATSRHNVLVIDDEIRAIELALWLNTCPVPRAITDVGLWQLMPLGEFDRVPA